MIKNITENNKEVRPNSSALEVLHKDFANCFNNEGKFDIAKFQSLISDKVDLVKENQGFDFLGKSYAKMLASMESTTVIVPDEEHNSKPENRKSKNIYISGDNLDALKHLVRSYAGMVKCIYIDPPYNTGSDGFVYNDKFGFKKEDLAVKLDIEEEQAERILSFNDGSTCSDAAWMTFMLPRLQKAKEMLTDDGVIFISIDDNEQANLKLLCDEVFGPENFRACFCKKGVGGKQASTYFELKHEYILCYSRINFDSGEIELGKGSYPYFDEGKQKYYSPMLLRKWGDEARAEDRKGMSDPIYYDGKNTYSLNKEDIENPIAILPMLDKITLGRWRWGNETIEDAIKQHVIEARIVDGEYVMYEKKYEPDEGEVRTKLFGTWIDDVDNTTGTKHLSSLFGGISPFEHPKPYDLIQKVLAMANLKDGDIVMDFFSGSATTAESVLRHSISNDIRINYFLVQLKEKCKKDSAARSLGFNTIDELGQARIRKAVQRLKAKNPLYKGDFGFKHYTLQELPEETIDKLEEFKPLEFVGAEEMLKLMGGKEAVLTTWLCDDHYGLGAEVQHIKLGGYTAYYLDKHLYMLDGGFNEQAMSDLMVKYERDAMDFHPSTIVVFGYSFSLAEMLMLKKNIPALKDNENGTNITVDIRY